MSNFQPLEVVDRGSETQPQLVENLNKFTLSASFEYLCYGYTAVINILILSARGSTIYVRIKRQILTSRVDPRAVSLKLSL